MAKTTVQLFKSSGKYYTQDDWEIPADAIGPSDMQHSPDFRCLPGGFVLVLGHAWGFPHLIVEEGS